MEIVSHCWAGKYEHYAAGLAYQLSSLLLDDVGAHDITATVCCDPADEITKDVLCWFDGYGSSELEINVIELSQRHLGRRAIGRNHAALTTGADLMWFADVDQCWHDGCLKRLAEMQWPDGAVMIYPREIMFHKDKTVGDEDLSRAFPLGGSPFFGSPITIKDNFKPKRYNRAIGGVQIVKGDFAREYGYLDGDLKWQGPVENPFRSFLDDIAYRKFCLSKGKIVGVDLPGMYRMRHTDTTHHLKQ